jgi:hypothetical protein
MFPMLQCECRPGRGTKRSAGGRALSFLYYYKLYKYVKKYTNTTTLQVFWYFLFLFFTSFVSIFLCTPSPDENAIQGRKRGGAREGGRERPRVAPRKQFVVRIRARDSQKVALVERVRDSHRHFVIGLERAHRIRHFECGYIKK